MSDTPLPIPQPNALNDAKGQTTQTGYRYYQSLDASIRSLATLRTEVAGKASATQTWEQSWLIEYPEAKDYRVVLNADLARTITKVTTRSSAGTCTLTVKINSTALGGSVNSVSTTEQSQVHSSANAVAVGDDIVLAPSSVSSAEMVSVTISGTMTLA